MLEIVSGLMYMGWMTLVSVAVPVWGLVRYVGYEAWKDEAPKKK